MNDAVTYAPTRDSDPARPAGNAARPWANWPVVTRGWDVMTRDPDRVAGSDTLMEVAGIMRSLLVAFLPICDERGDLQGIIACGTCTAFCGPVTPARPPRPRWPANPR